MKKMVLSIRRVEKLLGNEKLYKIVKKNHSVCQKVILLLRNINKDSI